VTAAVKEVPAPVATEKRQDIGEQDEDRTEQDHDRRFAQSRRSHQETTEPPGQTAWREIACEEQQEYGNDAEYGQQRRMKQITQDVPMLFVMP
jgi:hypothetical protein